MLDEKKPPLVEGGLFETSLAGCGDNSEAKSPRHNKQIEPIDRGRRAAEVAGMSVLPIDSATRP
jgi:hypothetical protein